MINRLRIGANYLIYSSVVRLILNKILFITANLLIYFYSSLVLDVIAVVLMCIPLIKKCIVHLVDKYYYSECALIISAVILLAAVKDVKSAALLLAVYHVFDFCVFIIYGRIYDEFWKSSAVFENPINYRFDANGDYVLSNNEYVPAEGEVISGNALVGCGRICADAQEAFPVHPGDKLLFSYKILNGSIHYRTFTKADKSVYNAIKNYCNETVSVCRTDRISRLFDIFKAVLTVAFLTFAAIALLFELNVALSFFVVSFALSAALSLLFVFADTLEYDFMTRLHKNGLYIIKNPCTKKISVLEKSRMLKTTDTSKHNIFSAYLPGDEAQGIFEYLDKRRAHKQKALVVLVAVCAALLVLSCVTTSVLLTSIILFAAVVAAVIIIKIN